MHACTAAAGQSCSFARSRLRHPMRCWQHLSDGAIAWSRTNDSDARAYLPRTFDGLRLRANVQAESDLKNARMHRGCRAELQLCSLAAALLVQSFGCVTAEAAQTARCFACTCRAHFSGLLLCPSNDAWKRSQMHACTAAAGQSCSFAVTRNGAGSI